jgi:peptide/nickel transport system permease protein|tara:strand:+ start:161 stop:1240 length:1080 start_codon:yes stop_codon:yes gene_type:complete
LGRYILKKIQHSFWTLLGVVTTIFFLFNVLPGDPAQMMLGQNEDQAQLAIVKQKYGFDQPVLTQYLYYLNDLSPLSFHSNSDEDYTFLESHSYSFQPLIKTANTTFILKYPYLRTSFTKQGKKVSQILKETLPNTIILAVASICVALVLGLFLGVISALYKDHWVDKTILVVSTFGMSLPSFFSAILAAWIFGFLLHHYTGLEMTGSLYELDDFGEVYQLQLKNLILPALVLGIRPLAVVTQLMRNSLLEVFNQDYIRTARAKGLSEFQIITRHAMKNALNPVVTAISGWFASLLAGAVFVEYIFAWNGLGKEIVNALNTLDLPVIMGAVLIIALTFVLINIFVDIIYTYLDPKIKLNS